MRTLMSLILFTAIIIPHGYLLADVNKLSVIKSTVTTKGDKVELDLEYRNPKYNTTDFLIVIGVRDLNNKSILTINFRKSVNMILVHSSNKVLTTFVGYKRIRKGNKTILKAVFPKNSYNMYSLKNKKCKVNILLQKDKKNDNETLYKTSKGEVNF